MKKTVVFTLFVFGMAVFWNLNLCFATTWDVAADFSATNNPNSVWSYGWSSALTSAFNLYPDNGKMGPVPIDVWVDLGVFYPFISSSTPNVGHNGTGIVNTDHPTIIWQPDQFSLHPGQSGEYSHAFWTAPYAGTFDIASTFTGIDLLGTTTDVHVLHNGISLFDGLVNGFGNTSSFLTTVQVGIGDIIDFTVGDGGNGHSCDTTALSVTIVPEPATLLLLTLGGLFLRKRK